LQQIYQLYSFSTLSRIILIFVHAIVEYAREIGAENYIRVFIV